MNLNSSEALEYKKEVTGGYASPLVHFAKMSGKIEYGLTNINEEKILG